MKSALETIHLIDNIFLMMWSLSETCHFGHSIRDKIMSLLSDVGKLRHTIIYAVVTLQTPIVFHIKQLIIIYCMYLKLMHITEHYLMTSLYLCLIWSNVASASGCVSGTSYSSSMFSLSCDDGTRLSVCSTDLPNTRVC